MIDVASLKHALETVFLSMGSDLERDTRSDDYKVAMRIEKIKRVDIFQKRGENVLF